MLSGVQPTGTLHLGNYLGAIRNWVKMQELYGLSHSPATCSMQTSGSYHTGGKSLCISALQSHCCGIKISEDSNDIPSLSCADTFFCVVDLHAITLPHEPKDLLEATRKSAALYIASGINPDKASIFVQSHVSAHAELAWLLQCYTPIG